MDIGLVSRIGSRRSMGHTTSREAGYMIISPGRKFIFVHIPKTGGTSMALALEARAMKEDILIGDTPKALRRKRRLKGAITAGRLWKHSTLSDVEGLVSREDMATYRVFTLVRNPWDRLVSYYHWLQQQSFDHPAVHLSKSLSFSAFLNHSHTRDSVTANPYARYVTDSAGMCHGDDFIRIEQFRQDIDPVEAYLGFAIRLHHVNRSARPADWRPFYTESDAELVARLCANDIARSGYTFDPIPTG